MLNPIMVLLVLYLSNSIIPSKQLPTVYVPYADGNLDAPPLHTIDDDPDLPDGTYSFEKPLTDQCINSELNLTLGEQMKHSKVIGCYKDNDGNVVGSHDENLVLNTMVYDVEFPDGAVRKYTANIITENMFYQVDSNGLASSILDGIIEYAKADDAVSMNNQ